jgi:hypothetical protein
MYQAVGILVINVYVVYCHDYFFSCLFVLIILLEKKQMFVIFFSQENPD